MDLFMNDVESLLSGLNSYIILFIKIWTFNDVSQLTNNIIQKLSPIHKLYINYCVQKRKRKKRKTYKKNPIYFETRRKSMRKNEKKNLLIKETW